MAANSDSESPPQTEWTLAYGKNLLGHIGFGRDPFFDRSAQFELSDAAAVIVRGFVGERSDGEGAWRLAVWSVRVVTRSADPDTCLCLEPAREPQEPSPSDSGAGYRAASLRRAREIEPVRAVLPELIEASVFVGEHSDEVISYRIATALALALNVPLIDATIDVPVLSWPNELGMALVERLSLGITPVPEDPGEPPPGIRCDQDTALDVRWHREVDVVAVLGALVLGVVLGAAVNGALHVANDVAGRTLFWLPYWTLGFCVAAAALALFLWPTEYGWNQLRVSNDSLDFRRGPHRWSSSSMPTSEVESLRVTTPGPEGFHLEALRVVSNSGIIVMRMPLAQARWIAARVTRYLAKEP